MKLKHLTATLIALGIAAPAWAADFTIKNFRIEGEQHTSEATVRSLLPVKEGDTYTDAVGEEVFTGGATAIAVPKKGVVVVGGVNKDVFLAAINKLPEGYLLHEPEWYRFNSRVLCYCDGAWTQLLQHPSVARAGCALAYWDGWVYVVGGELKPGIRTPEIVRFRVD